MSTLAVILIAIIGVLAVPFIAGVIIVLVTLLAAVPLAIIENFL